MQEIEVRAIDNNLSKKIKHSIEYKLLDKSRYIAIDVLKKFYIKNNFDMEIIESIKEIPIYIDNMNNVKDATAVYDSNKYEICFDYNELMNIHKYSSNIIDYISTLVKILIHEYLHSIRDLNLKYSYDYERKSSESEEYDILYEKFNKDIEQKEGNYVKVLSVTNKNSQYFVLAYNYDTGTFSKYLIPKYLVHNKKDLIASIEKMINNNYIIWEKDDYLISPYENIYPKTKSTFFGFREGEDEEVINPTELMSDNYEYLGIEESLVEAFANIIVMSTYGDYNIQNCARKLLRKKYYTYDVRLAFILISKMSSEEIKWFFNSYMLDNFEYKISELYGDKFNDVLEYFDYLYNLNDSSIEEYKSLENNNVYRRAKRFIEQ